MQETLRFVELVNGPSTSVDLTEGALLLVAHAHPDVDIEAQAGRIDELAAACSEPTLDGVRRLLFQELGFTGDTGDYYDPANSLLDCVLERRRGLPITLSLLTIEVGRRLGVPLDGVGMPGHFLVRDRVLPDVFVDPFDGGRELSAADCQAIFRRLAGRGVPFDPAYLEPVSGVSILGRMAANLVNAYRRRDDRSGLRWSARLRSRCPGAEPAELVQLGQALGRTGAWGEAADLLEEAAPAMATPDGVSSVRTEALRFRSRLN
jgi:regulator of sirC expression with transglutaminase-like and TPR domain